MKTQEIKDNLTRLHSVPVVAFEEGLRLGRVEDVYIDRRAKRVQGISFKSGLWGKETASYVDLAEILKIGRDVIIVSRQSAAIPLDAEMAQGSLRHLKGFKITTHDGAYIGEVLDLNVNPEDGSISEIMMNDNQLLAVDVEEIVLGPDVIVVPAGYVSRITHLEAESNGLLSRMLGPAAVTDTLRDKYEEIKASVGGGKGADKMFDTLRSGSEKTRETVKRTSRKIQETIEQMRRRRATKANGLKEEDEGYQGAEAEHAGRTFAEDDSEATLRPSDPAMNTDDMPDSDRSAATDEPWR